MPFQPTTECIVRQMLEASVFEYAYPNGRLPEFVIPFFSYLVLSTASGVENPMTGTKAANWTVQVRGKEKFSGESGLNIIPYGSGPEVIADHKPVLGQCPA